VVLDVTDTMLVGPEPVTSVLVRAGHTDDRMCGQVSVVCPHASGRSLLRMQTAAGQSAVFSSLGDALQALVMAADGLGSGWSPGSGRRRQPSHLRLV
jgi:hypothetical protein